MNRRTIFRAYGAVLAALLLFWWPLSHWFFSDWYHDLLGFDSYEDSFSKMIGTLGLLPVAGLVILARHPERYRELFLALLGFMVCLAATYVYLIIELGWPTGEYFNVALIGINLALLLLLYPWRASLLASNLVMATAQRSH
ncbi:MAG: hypothetical protein GYB65_07775 [Chloroflexi bacterium]|nr:hypothetical protein [Chloroflexota bacterium]